nr:HepT-like ribonuclease domain-containing protein [Rathayibacter sp. VKM Ac-2857]
MADIAAAAAAIRAHLDRGGLDDGLVFDAVRMRLVEIGEAVKDLPQSLLETEPEVPWRDVAGMRDRFAHRYFDTTHAILAATVTTELPALEAAVRRLRERASED